MLEAKGRVRLRPWQIRSTDDDRLRLLIKKLQLWRSGGIEGQAGRLSKVPVQLVPGEH